VYAIEFEATKNSIVHIPQQYQELQQSQKVRFIVIPKKLMFCNE